MAVNAAPTTTATARSTTFPRRMKSLKPLSTRLVPSRWIRCRAQVEMLNERCGSCSGVRPSDPQWKTTVRVLVSDAAATSTRLRCRHRDQHHPVASPCSSRRRRRARPPRRWPRVGRCIVLTGAYVGTRRDDVDAVADAEEIGDGIVREADWDDSGIWGSCTDLGEPGPEHAGIGEDLAGAGRAGEDVPERGVGVGQRSRGGVALAAIFARRTSATSSRAPGARSRAETTTLTCSRPGSPRNASTTAKQGQRGREHPAGSDRAKCGRVDDARDAVAE